jgi:hypothetical protein
MRVLVEARTLTSDLWFVEYEGRVIVQTNTRYLVRHHIFFKSWVPINGYLMRCSEITKIGERP